MAPLAKVKFEEDPAFRGIQNPPTQERRKQHDVTINVVKQVQRKVDDSDKALIMTEVNKEEIKVITNSGNFKYISEEVVKLQVGGDIKTDTATARVIDQHAQTDRNGITFMLKTEFRVTDLVTSVQQKSVLHTYFSKTFFMIQGKGPMHDKSSCRDYFHKNVMMPFISKIMQEKGKEIKNMNKILQSMKGDNPKRKLPEKKDKCDILAECV